MDVVGTIGAAGPSWHLTAREREVLIAVSHGLSSRAIGEQLGISIHTVQSHLRWAMAKLNAPTRAAAVHGALARGLL